MMSSVSATDTPEGPTRSASPRSQLAYSFSAMSRYDVEALLRTRTERDEHFRTHYTSPIPEDHLPGFVGLSYFEPDPGLVLHGSMTVVEGKREIISSTGGTSSYRLAGHLEILIGGQDRRLVVLYGDEDEMFIPFRDGTCGKDSYGGGRYVGLTVAEDGSSIVDFNRAINPWCAYDEEFSCPLPPAENWLEASLPAGEKAYQPPVV